ncbi:pentapeptide repeat-containing protein [Fluoribacter dumoffii]|uniref:Serine/threonine-protein kinase B n=1 Tax=Fluoribacter dumoffii TaxID=463 RepID=A0A377ITM9_9GAMM|nr:pentapeptide repeat-containing protein [Fluoribacter dumoffii]STO91556.1 Serine/threonine-protein kinase B [Fluoribacter dumoffii]
MNHLIKNTLFLYLLLTFKGVYAGQYVSDDDLEQLRTTKSCMKCDFSYSTIKQWNVHFESLVSNSSFTGAFIDSSNFRGSDFSGCTLTRLKVLNTLLVQSNFSNARMQYIVFNNVQLSGSKLVNAQLQNANLSYTNLSSVDFTGANTQGVIFDHALLIGSNITIAQLNRAKSLSCAVMPDGTVYPANKNDKCDLGL